MSTRKRSASKKEVVPHGKNDLVGLTLKEIKPITIAQKDVFDSYNEGYNLFLHGMAGTGKSFLSMYLGLRELIKSPLTYEKIIIVRSAVSSRDVGFLPGNVKEKMMAYEEPYAEISKELFERGDAYDILKAKGKIVFTSSSFLRGITFRNAIVIVDEVQNQAANEIMTVMTRIGQNCKVILCGDNEQDDLVIKKNDTSWFGPLKEIVFNMNCFDMIKFEIEDIVRSAFVKEFLIAKHNFLSRKSE